MNRKNALKNMAGLAAFSSLVSVKSSTDSLSGAILKSFNPENDWIGVKAMFNIEKEKIYLNNGTIGPNPQPVLKAIIEALEERARTVEYSGWSKARSSFASLINCDKKEICLTENTTHGNNIVIQGLKLSKGDQIITSTHEHVGNAMPILNRARKSELELKVFNPAQSKQEVLKQLDKLISPKTRAICLPHISCTTGQLFPIREISELINGRNIFLAIDGAHGPGSRVVDVKDLACDSYTTSCHKWLMGAYGTGFAYIKLEKLDELDVGYIGHSGSSEWKLDPEGSSYIEKVDSAARFMYGTKSTPQFLGSVAAVDFHKEIGSELIQKRIAQLQEYLFNGLMEREKKLEYVSPLSVEDRGPMQTFVPKTIDFKLFWKKCSDANIRVRQLPEAGINGIRVSTHIYNSKTDIDRLFEIIDSSN